MSDSKKNIAVLYCLAVMFTIWCTWNSAGSGKLLNKLNDYRVEVYQFERQVASLIDKVNAFEQREMLKEIKELELPESK